MRRPNKADTHPPNGQHTTFNNGVNKHRNINVEVATAQRQHTSGEANTQIRIQQTWIKKTSLSTR